MAGVAEGDEDDDDDDWAVWSNQDDGCDGWDGCDGCDDIHERAWFSCIFVLLNVCVWCCMCVFGVAFVCLVLHAYSWG